MEEREIYELALQTVGDFLELNVSCCRAYNALTLEEHGLDEHRYKAALENAAAIHDVLLVENILVRKDI